MKYRTDNLVRMAPMLRASLDEFRDKKVGKNGVRHMLDCRLGPRISMSNGGCSERCKRAREALDLADRWAGESAQS